jgi:hypothetical protein
VAYIQIIITVLSSPMNRMGCKIRWFIVAYPLIKFQPT